jgi:hypothetical protein
MATASQRSLDLRIYNCAIYSSSGANFERNNVNSDTSGFE